MGPHSQHWDCDQKDDALKKLNVKDASTQTPEYKNKVIDAKIIKLNKRTINQKDTIKSINQGQIMSEIIRLFERLSQ